MLIKHQSTQKINKKIEGKKTTKPTPMRNKHLTQQLVIPILNSEVKMNHLFCYVWGCFCHPAHPLSPNNLSGSCSQSTKEMAKSEAYAWTQFQIKIIIIYIGWLTVMFSVPKIILFRIFKIIHTIKCQI